MSWIEFHAALRDHWKIKRLADTLKITYATALGEVSCLWLWAIDYAPGGSLKTFKNNEIGEASRHIGDSKGYVEALIDCKLIDKNMRIHDWHKHGVRLLKSHRIRQARYRHAQHTPNVTVMSPCSPTDLTLQTVQTLPNQQNIYLGKKERKVFERPTAQQVTEYAASIAFPLDGQQFVDHYEARGWIVGKVPMKNWQAAVRTWKTNHKNGGMSYGRNAVGTSAGEAAPRPGKYAD